MKLKPAGITPTTECNSPLTRRSRPSAAFGRAEELLREAEGEERLAVVAGFALGIVKARP